MKEMVKEIKVMKEERVDSNMERVAGESDDGKVRIKMLDKRRNRYGSSIDLKKVRKLYI